jgi:hypothetical protein
MSSGSHVYGQTNNVALARQIPRTTTDVNSKNEKALKQTRTYLFQGENEKFESIQVLI